MIKLKDILLFPYRWLYFYPILILDTAILATIAVVVAVFVSPKASSRWLGFIWARLNSMLTPMLVKVSGRENIKKGKSYVVIANHQSHYDIWLIYGWLGLDIKWVMKKELRKVPGLGIAAEKMGHIYLDRSDTHKAIESLKIAKERIKDGSSIVIFPEGTRSVTAEMLPFKRGAFKMALEMNLPILPVSIIGTREILPAQSLKLLPGKAQLIIHPEVDTTKYSNVTIEQLINDVRTAIEKPLV